MSILLSRKLRLSSPGVYLHWCGGCQSHHLFYVDKPTEKGARWSFDGNIEKPTFSPSMLISIGPEGDPNDPTDFVPRTTLCHYYLTNGIITYLEDCQHNLKGCQVELPDLPKWNW